MKFFLRICVMIFLTIHIAVCGSSHRQLDEDWRTPWDGWGGNPEGYNNKPYDYFYYRNGYGTLNLKELAKTKTPESLCKEISLKDTYNILIRKMIGESMQGNINDSEFDRIGNLLVIKYLVEKEKIQTKDCRPLFMDDPKNPNNKWRECECLVYVHIPGGKDTIIKEAKELQKLNQ